MDILLLILLGVFPALVIVGGLHDLITMKIPNWISLALIGAFFPAALLVGVGPMDIAIHLGVGVVALMIGMGMFALNWIGGGDAKLLAASCLWMGLSGVAPFLLWTGVAGGLFCLLLIMARQVFPHRRALGFPRMGRQSDAAQGRHPLRRRHRHRRLDGPARERTGSGLRIRTLRPS